MRTIAILAACVLVSACNTMERRVARATEQCIAYGHKPNTPEMANCIAMVDQQDQTRRSTISAGAAAIGAANMKAQTGP